MVDMNSVADDWTEYCSEIEVDDDFESCLLERALDYDVLEGVLAGFGVH